MIIVAGPGREVSWWAVDSKALTPTTTLIINAGAWGAAGCHAV